MYKMDDVRAKLDAESSVDVRASNEWSNKEINKIIEGKPTEIHRPKPDPDKMGKNMKLAARVVDLNPDLPPAFKSKFEIMSENAHFAINVYVVIEDARKHIDLKLTDGKVYNSKIEPIGERKGERAIYFHPCVW